MSRNNSFLLISLSIVKQIQGFPVIKSMNVIVCDVMEQTKGVINIASIDQNLRGWISHKEVGKDWSKGETHGNPIYLIIKHTLK